MTLGLFFETTEYKERIEEMISIETMPGRSLWTEKDGVIYLDVTSRGEVVSYFIDRYTVLPYALNVLESRYFQPTHGVKMRIAILRGKDITTNERTNAGIRALAAEQGLIVPSVEAACLIHEALSQDGLQAMGLRAIYTMHEPVSVGKTSTILGTYTRDDGEYFLMGFYGRQRKHHEQDRGFAFIAP